MAGNVRVTTELKNPNEIGTHHRFLCMTGPNKGKVYYLTGKRIIIGRGENADIQILDTKISREHAELAFADKSYVITDLGAQNGIIVNDQKIKQAKLNDNEKVVIGQTVFKYNVIVINQLNELIIAEATPDSALAKEIKKGVKPTVALKKAKSGFVDDGPRYTPTPSEPKAEGKSRILIIGIILFAVIFVLFGDNEPAKSKSASRKGASNNDIDTFNESMSVKNIKLDPDVRKKLEGLIHSGRREFREGNYFRAMEEFRLALLLNPNNGSASFYLSKAKQRLDDEIKKNFEKGTQEQDAKKYQAAIVSFCSVIQLIQEYPDDERYKNALIKLSSIESSLGLEKGEIKCFEEKPADPGN